MKQITVRTMLQIHDELQRGIPAFLEYFLDGRIGDFAKSAGGRIKTAHEKINKLQHEHFMIKDGKIVEEIVYEDVVVSDKKLIGSRKRTVKKEVGKIPVLSGKMSDEEYKKRLNEIFNEKVVI